jgi:uncharacterized protein (TIGR02266 family)
MAVPVTGSLIGGRWAEEWARRRDLMTEIEPVPKILLVDDVQLFLELEKTFLRPYDCDILTASSGERALELVSSARPALVILDDQMPGIGGLEACRRIKSDANLETTTVVMTSSPDLEKACFEAGADGFIGKPFLQAGFVEQVRKFLPKLNARANRRAFVHLDIDILLEDRAVPASIRDISSTGLFVRTDLPVQVGQPVRLRLTLPGDESPTEVQGEVRNKVAGDAAKHLSPGFGVVFSNLDADARARIGAYVSRLEKGEDPTLV